MIGKFVNRNKASGDELWLPSPLATPQRYRVTRRKLHARASGQSRALSESRSTALKHTPQSGSRRQATAGDRHVCPRSEPSYPCLRGEGYSARLGARVPGFVCAAWHACGCREVRVSGGPVCGLDPTPRPQCAYRRRAKRPRVPSKRTLRGLSLHARRPARAAPRQPSAAAAPWCVCDHRRLASRSAAAREKSAAV